MNIKLCCNSYSAPVMCTRLMNHNAGSIMNHEEICENSSTPSDTDPRVSLKFF
jgi:hypothetical protein